MGIKGRASLGSTAWLVDIDIRSVSLTERVFCSGGGHHTRGHMVYS